MPSPIGPIVIKFLADTKELGSGLSRASSLIRDWSLVTTGITQGITNAFKTIASVGVKALTVGLAGLAGAFLLTAKGGADFEDNMVRTFAILQESSGATENDFRRLTEEARRLGRDTLASGKEAGLYKLARSPKFPAATHTIIPEYVRLSCVEKTIPDGKLKSIIFGTRSEKIPSENSSCIMLVHVGLPLFWLISKR